MADRERSSHYCWSALWHGLLLWIALSVLHIEKVGAFGLDPSVGEWLGLLLPNLAFVLIFEAFWLAIRTTAGERLPRLMTVLFFGAHLAVYFLSIDAHTFLLKTGHRPHFTLLSYTTRHFQMLKAVVFSGIDRHYWLRLGGSLGCVVLGAWLTRRCAWRRLSPLRTGLVMLLVGLLLSTWSPIRDRRLNDLAGNDLWAFAGSLSPALRTGPEVERFVVTPGELYESPRVGRPAERPPNVLLLILESTGAGVSPPEGRAELMPELTAMAQGGVVVENFYTSVSHTSKALIGLQCGMYPRLSMPIVESLEGNLPLHCLPHLLSAIGYRTAFLQSALGGFENRPGLTRNLGFSRSAFLETLERPGYDKVGYFGLDEFAMLAPATDWATSASAEPFFLTVLTSNTHHPYEAPGGSKELAAADPQAGYEETLRYQDRFVGELYRKLEAAGVLEDTVFLIVGDHGEAFGQHMRFQHDAVPYEEVVRTPLVMLGSARLGEPRRIGGLRHHVDLLPTLLELADLPYEGVLPGRSLLSTSGHDQVVSSCWYDRFCLALREGDRKVVYHFERSPTEVFDLATDPGEKNDLAAGLPAEELRELEARAVAFQRSVDDFWATQPLHQGPEEWWRREEFAAADH